MVLQPDVPGFGHLAEGAVEFVGRAVGVPPRRGPAAQVHFGDSLAVQINPDVVVLGAEDHVIPFARGFAGVVRGGLDVIDRAAALRGCGVPAVCVQDLDFDSGLHGVVQIGPSEEDAAVGAGRVLELERQFEIPEPVFRIIQVFALFRCAEDTATIYRPAIGIARGCPAVEGFAVEQLHVSSFR